MGGDVAQLVEHRTGTPPTQVRFPGAVKDFSLRVNLQCRLSYCVRTPPHAIACIHICAHVKDPVVHVRVRWIMETLKYPACTLVWAARLCRSWLSPEKATRIPHGRNSTGTIQLQKVTKKKKKGPCDIDRWEILGSGLGLLLVRENLVRKHQSVGTHRSVAVHDGKDAVCQTQNGCAHGRFSCLDF